MSKPKPWKQVVAGTIIVLVGAILAILLGRAVLWFVGH